MASSPPVEQSHKFGQKDTKLVQLVNISNGFCAMVKIINHSD